MTEQKEVKEKGNGLVIQLSEATKESIATAAAKFNHFGLTEQRARQMVAAKAAELAAGISAVELFAEEVKSSLQ